MAVSTFTSTFYGTSPRLVHSGANKIGGELTISGRTVSDIGFLARIPNKATIWDYYIRGTSGETLSSFKLGIDGASAAGSAGGPTAGSATTFGTRTLSTGAVVVVNDKNGLPWKVSLSDTDNIAGGATIYMTVSAGTWTTSISMQMSFEYWPDGLGV